MSQKSVLELEILRKLAGLRSSVAAHDKGVLLGFLLCLLPIFPTACFGLAIGLFNFSLWESGKLDIFEGRLIRIGIVLGLVNCAIGAAIVAGAIYLLSGFGWEQYFDWVEGLPLWIFHRIVEFWNNAGNPIGRGIQV